MNDLISRSAAIEEVEQWAEHGYDVIHWTGIKAMLETQPAIDAVPVRRGRWVNVCETDHRLRECSVCHDWQIHYEKYIPKYCPNCGAKMDALTCGPDYCEIGGGDDE